MVKVHRINEAKRGFYIDFEGTMKHPPSILGVYSYDEYRSKENFTQYVIEQALWPMTEYVPEESHGYRPVNTESITETLTNIRQACISEDRKIFAFGSHEIKEIKKLMAEANEKDDFDWWKENLINIQPLARKWVLDNKQLIEFEKLWKKYPEDGKFTLVNFKRFFDHDVPVNLAKGKPAKAIGEMRKMLNDKNGDISKLTSTKKRNWTRMLRHNWHDCQSTRLLNIECARS